MWVHRDIEAGGLTGTLDNALKAGALQRTATLAHENEGIVARVPVELAQSADRGSIQRVHRRPTSLEPRNLDSASVEINVAALQIDQLADAQPMPRCHVDHQPIAVTVAITLGRFLQALDFLRCQMPAISPNRLV